MFKDSIFRGLTRREAEDLINAVKHDKYWRIDPKNRDLICIVALSRARIKSRRGMYAKATYLKKVEVSMSAAKFCRKWRILLVDVKTMLAVSVLTWKAFNNIISSGLGPIVCSMSIRGEFIPYFNTSTVSRILKDIRLSSRESTVV